MPSKKATTNTISASTVRDESDKPNRPLKTSDRRQKLHDDYERQVEELNEAIEETVHRDERELANIRHDQLARLKALLVRRSKIEDEIFAHAANVEELSMSADTELMEVLQGRIGDLDHIMDVVGRDSNGEAAQDDGEGMEYEETEKGGGEKRCQRNDKGEQFCG